MEKTISYNTNAVHSELSVDKLNVPSLPAFVKEECLDTPNPFLECDNKSTQKAPYAAVESIAHVTPKTKVDAANKRPVQLSDKDVFTREEAAEIINQSPHTLAKWQSEQKYHPVAGKNYLLKVSGVRRAIYSKQSIIDFLNHQHNEGQEN